MDGSTVWCGSVIRGDDGRYHMFASRWSAELHFGHWLTNSEVVRGVSDRPEGPYRFAEVVLPVRGTGWWDGLMTHNPTIHRCGDTYLLYYIGTRYEGGMPTALNQVVGGGPKHRQARANQRIGLATAPSVFGPWTRRDEPILLPREGKWDALMTTNPAPCVNPDGSVLLIYKAVAHQKDLLRLGAAYAENYLGPYHRLSDEPIFRFDATNDHVEDPYVWAGEAGGYQLIMKDMAGGIVGEIGGGIHATSPDGVNWSVSDPPKAYSRTVTWDDGATTEQAAFERPQLLIEDGRPTHLFAATGNSKDGKLWHFEGSPWNLCVPLKA